MSLSNDNFDNRLAEKVPQWLHENRTKNGRPFHVPKVPVKHSRLWWIVVPRWREAKERFALCWEVLWRGTPDRIEW